jgi:hypothetical protein
LKKISIIKLTGRQQRSQFIVHQHPASPSTGGVVSSPARLEAIVTVERDCAEGVRWRTSLVRIEYQMNNNYSTLPLSIAKLKKLLL